MKPAAIDTQPPPCPLIANTVPSAMQNSAIRPMMGQGMGCGTACAAADGR
jgi:hypothetical protein